MFVCLLFVGDLASRGWEPISGDQGRTCEGRNKQARLRLWLLADVQGPAVHKQYDAVTWSAAVIHPPDKEYYPSAHNDAP